MRASFPEIKGPLKGATRKCPNKGRRVARGAEAKTVVAVIHALKASP